MSAFPKSKAAFIRWIKEPGATLTGVSHSFADRFKNKEEFLARFHSPRTIVKPQTNGMKLSDGGWLMFENGTKLSFEGDIVTVTVPDHDQASIKNRVISYRMSIGEVL